jgi:hypothetical protein
MTDKELLMQTFNKIGIVFNDDNNNCIATPGFSYEDPGSQLLWIKYTFDDNGEYEHMEIVNINQ